MNLSPTESETLRAALHTARAAYQDLADRQRLHNRRMYAERFEQHATNVDALLARLESK